MLVVARKVGESVVVEDDQGNKILIVVKQIRQNQVRIGIEAPKTYVILRGELVRRKTKREES